MKKVQVNNKIFFCKVINKPNIDILGITISMWKQQIFETIYTNYYVLNIQDTTGKGFGSR